MQKIAMLLKWIGLTSIAGSCFMFFSSTQFELSLLIGLIGVLLLLLSDE